MTRRVECVHLEASLANLRASLASSPHHYFPVIDSKERPVGVFSFDRAREHQSRFAGPADELTAGQVMSKPTAIVAVGATMEDVAAFLSQPQIDLVLVVDTIVGPKLVGVLSRADVMRAHQVKLEARLTALRRPREDQT